MTRYFRVEGTLATGWKHLPMAETFVVHEPIPSADLVPIITRRSELYFRQVIRDASWKRVEVLELDPADVTYAVQLPPEPERSRAVSQ